MRPVTISSKYRITIPPEIRKQFGIKPGDKVSFIPYDNSLEMVIVSSVKNGHESERRLIYPLNAREKCKKLTKRTNDF